MASVVVTDSNFVVGDDLNTPANKDSYSVGMREFGVRIDNSWGQTSEDDRPELIFDVFSGLLADDFKVYRIRNTASDNLRIKALQNPQFKAGDPDIILWEMVQANGSIAQFRMVFRGDTARRMVVSIPNSNDIQGYQDKNVEIVKSLGDDAARDFLVAASLISRCR